MAHAPYITSQLSNGLRYVYVPAMDRKSVCVTLLGKVGSHAEQDHELGAAHFLEHLFFDGTKKRPSALEINRFIEQTGASSNGYTTTETVEYYARVINEEAETAFDFISDIFLHSLLKDIDKERSTIAQEAAAHNDNPSQLLFWRQQPTIYPNQRMGRSFADEAANLPNITESIILDYYKRTYVVQNFVLCVAGCIEYERAEVLAQKYFSGIGKGKKVTFETPHFNEDAVIDIQNRDLQQSKIALTFRGFGLDDERAVPARMLALILGYGFSSRLTDMLRTKLHLVYDASAYHSRHSDTGNFSIKTSVDESKLQQATDEIIKVIRVLLEDGITDDELDKAKNIALTGLLFDSENPTTLGDIYSYRHLLTGDIKTVDQLSEDIKSVSKEQVGGVAQLIFSDKPKVNVLTSKLKELRINPIL
jgi:predicted Zn-dependent peptidase